MNLNKPLWKGGFILLVTFGLFGFLNFVFQLSMARMLSISDYAIFATLFSIVYVLSVFSESVQTVITKYASVEKEDEKLKNILKRSLKKSFAASVVLFSIYLVVSIPLSYVLEIKYPLLAITGILIFSAFTLPVTRGVMQGRKNFRALGLNMVFESLLKLILGVFFVFLGWKVYGALVGAILGFFAAFLLSFIPLRRVIGKKEGRATTIGIYSYAKPTFFIILAVVAFYSIDIIIAKIVLNSEDVGAYAIASVLSKAIFWGTQPISKAMFPLSSESFRSEKNSEEIFFNAFGLVFVLASIALAAFYFFPGLIILIFSGKFVYDSISILFYLGVGTSLISLSNLVLLYKLSQNKTKKYWRLYLFLAIEIALLFYFSSNLIQFSLAFVTSAAIFLWGSLTLMNH